MFNLQEFISKFITGRTISLFDEDIRINIDILNQEILGKSILVIGGAGTIGCSFIKAVLCYKPSSLVVVDINENGLTELTRDLRSSTNINFPADYTTYPMSFADSAFEKMFRNRHGFDIVANFSAHKHVRSEKDQYSVEALLENNVLKARKLLELMVEFTPKHFFCVSTDKATNPVNIMGASKKIMEEMIMAYSNKFPVTTARFANVAFSNGSLPAGFLERIAKQQPISAPSDVTRYFVSPEESGQICMLACFLGNSGEIFFPKLKMEEVLTFSEIATKLLNHLGYEIKECSSETEALTESVQLKNGSTIYPVIFSKSDTTGEKQYEEFHTDDEPIDSKRFSALGVITTQKHKSIDEINSLFNHLRILFAQQSTTKEDIVQIMKNFLPNFEHIEKEKSLDSKM